jgi:antitoxin component of RelBE/YafQ-DinJ toxin-antitoxin module
MPIRPDANDVSAYMLRTRMTETEIENARATARHLQVSMSTLVRMLLRREYVAMGGRVPASLSPALTKKKTRG